MMFFKLLARLPFFVLYRFSDVLFVLTAYVIRYRRQVVIANLRRAFPEASETHVRQLTRRFYRNFCDIIVETIKLPSLDADEVRKRIAVTNSELVERYINAGQTVIGAGAHQCNWEWVPAATIVSGVPVDSVYKPLHNAFSDRLMQQIRTRFGAYLIPMNRLPRELVARKGIPRVIALVADQMPNFPETAYWTNFLHQDTPFFPGTERLARSQNFPVVYLDLVRLRRGYYQGTFSVLAEPPYTDLPHGAIIDAYRDKLTETITRQPENWLWSHKRWKHYREQYAMIRTKLD